MHPIVPGILAVFFGLLIVWWVQVPHNNSEPSAKPRQTFSSTIEAWDHGFKTDCVVATRYGNRHLGFNIGFRFPKHTHTYDSPEVFDWFLGYGGTVLGGGGMPGGEINVIFEGVSDRESANKKLSVVLPALTEFMRNRR